MRCYICDAHLSPKEIKHHPVTNEIEPCSRCLSEAMESVREIELEEDDDHGEDDEPGAVPTLRQL